MLAGPSSGLPAASRAQLSSLAAALKADVAKIPRSAPDDKPATLGVGEPFTTTITVALYFALIVSLPVILYELYGFVLPALEPHERRAAMPLLGAVPVLFAIGVAFGYFVVLPAAVHFFVNFNSEQFNVIVQAGPYYRLRRHDPAGDGARFPGARRDPRRDPRGTRHAADSCARRAATRSSRARSIAALLPGEVITMVLEAVPLYLLYEASILLATLVARKDLERQDEGSTTNAGTRHPTEGPAPPTQDPAEPTVQELIDHIDPGLSS